jgi:hypothetical protein
MVSIIVPLASRNDPTPTCGWFLGAAAEPVQALNEALA